MPNSNTPATRRLRAFLRVQNWRVLSAIVYGTLLVCLFSMIDFRHALPAAIGWFQALPPAARIGFFILVGLSIPLMLPTTPFELGAGVLLPWWLAAPGCILAQTAGSCLALLLARHVLPEHWRSAALRQRHLQGLAHVLNHGGWKMVALTRLTPMFPVKASNYAYGLTSIRFGAFALGTMLGIAPRVTLNVYLGSLAGRLAAPGAGPITGWPWIAAVLVLAAICLVLIGRLTKRALHAPRH